MKEHLRKKLTKKISLLRIQEIMKPIVTANPPWKIYGKPYREFEEAELNVAGTYILVLGKETPLLMGDINQYRGTCSCCLEVLRDDVVIAYKPPPPSKEEIPSAILKFRDGFVQARKL